MSPLPHLLPQAFLPGPALPLNLPTVLITEQQKKSELRKDQSADLLDQWGFTLDSSCRRSIFLSSIPREREDQSEGESSIPQDRDPRGEGESSPGTSSAPLPLPL